MALDTSFLRIKLFYFLQLFALGCFSPFLPVLIRQKGFEAKTVGFIYTVLTFTTLIFKTGAAAIADYLRAHKAILLGGIVIMMFAFVGIYSAPPLNNVDDATQNTVMKKDQNKLLKTNSSSNNSNDNNKTHQNIESQAYTRYEFYVLFFFMILECMGGTSVAIMGETLCFSLLGSASTRYGEQRLWGTIGWGIAAAVGGAMIDRYSKGLQQTDFFPVVLMSITFLSFNFFNMFTLRFSLTQTRSGFGKLGSILLNPITALVLGSAGMKGLTIGMINTFKFLFMEEVAKEWDPNFPHMKFLEGLLIFIQCVFSEAPVFFISGFVIRRVGLNITYVISFATQSLRILLFANVSNPWYFLPLGLFHGLTFGLAHANMMAYAGSVVVKGAEASTQALFNVVYYVAMGLGGSVGGGLVSQLGYRRAFFYMGIANAVYTILYIIASSMVHQLCPKKNNELSSDPEKAPMINR